MEIPPVLLHRLRPDPPAGATLIGVEPGLGVLGERDFRALAVLATTQVSAELAEKLEQVFTDLAALDQDLVTEALRQLGLAGPSGPNPIDSPPASTEAIEMAYERAEQSLKPLGRGLVAQESLARRVGVLSFAPPTGWDTVDGVRDLLAPAGCGLPLLAACSPNSIPPERNALWLASRWIAARQIPAFEPARFAPRLTVLLAIEVWLWQLAFRHRGPTHQLPYAFRRRALTWFWSPEAQAPGAGGCGICIRCGSLIPPAATGRPRTNTEPRCSACAKEPPLTRQWPDHAIAPDAGGTWWLRCKVKGCDQYFSAERNRLRCDEHRSSRMTASKRRAIDGLSGWVVEPREAPSPSLIDRAPRCAPCAWKMPLCRHGEHGGEPPKPRMLPR